jgi:hypothetical protein
MVDTSVSLLERARMPCHAEVWRRLVELYEPPLNGGCAATPSPRPTPPTSRLID